VGASGGRRARPAAPPGPAATAPRCSAGILALRARSAPQRRLQSPTLPPLCDLKSNLGQARSGGRHARPPPLDRHGAGPSGRPNAGGLGSLLLDRSRLGRSRLHPVRSALPPARTDGSGHGRTEPARHGLLLTQEAHPGPGADCLRCRKRCLHEMQRASHAQTLARTESSRLRGRRSAARTRCSTHSAQHALTGTNAAGSAGAHRCPHQKQPATPDGQRVLHGWRAAFGAGSTCARACALLSVREGACARACALLSVQAGFPHRKQSAAEPGQGFPHRKQPAVEPGQGFPHRKQSAAEPGRVSRTESSRRWSRGRVSRTESSRRRSRGRVSRTESSRRRSRAGFPAPKAVGGGAGQGFPHRKQPAAEPGRVSRTESSRRRSRALLPGTEPAQAGRRSARRP
jgi:hypothetical protein